MNEQMAYENSAGWVNQQLEGFDLGRMADMTGNGLIAPAQTYANGPEWTKGQLASEFTDLNRSVSLTEEAAPAAPNPATPGVGGPSGMT